MLWRADLQRIQNQAKALIDEQEVFRRMRLSLSGSEGWHRSVRLVKVRLRIVLLFSFQRLSQNLQTIEAPEEKMPHGRIAFVESGRHVRVCCRLNVRIRGNESQTTFANTLALVYFSAKTVSQSGHCEQARLVVALMVAFPWSDCLSPTSRRRRRSIPDSAVQSALCQNFWERRDDPPNLFRVPIMSGSGFKGPFTDGQAKATRLECLKT